MDGNNITGSLDPVFCNPISSESKTLFDVTADCGGENPRVNCTCCTECCDRGTETCDFNVLAYCDIIAAANLPDPNGDLIDCGDFNCSCAEGGTLMNGTTAVATMTCTETKDACSQDETVCFYRQSFRVGFPSTFSVDFQNEATNEFQYSKGRDDSIVLFEPINGTETISVNGNECDGLHQWSCADGSNAPYIFCSNVEGAGDFNGCDPTSYEGGAFEMLSFILSGSFVGCPLLHAVFIE